MSDYATEKGLQNKFEEEMERAVNETIVNAKPTATDLPEAPASATVKIKTPLGFNWLFTVREKDVASLIHKMKFMEEAFNQANWSPENGFTKNGAASNTASNQPHNTAETPICKYHGKPMTWKTGVSKKTNKPYAFWSCSEKLGDGSWCDYKPERQ